MHMRMKEQLPGPGVEHANHAEAGADEPRVLSQLLQSCGGGPIVHARVPVTNLVCKLYRDDEIRVHLFYDEHDRLAQTRFDMDPYKSLPLAGGVTLHWAR